MLKGISPVISPELLRVLAEMGHGDEIVFGDANFPHESMGQITVRADGHLITELLEAILPLFPLDTFVEAPVALMEVVPGDAAGKPSVWDEYKAIAEKYAPGTKFEYIERFAYYERAKKAYAIVATGERERYANLLLKKGVI
ncbi:MAG: L-fucose mutarotase [Clostridiales Family XIII bacterium]|jgi:L-fucose mutarotase|nr:L-fucose mutarotase [Clostridiales Family XIII bacterium]